jgi:hypothetical protein
VLAKVEYAATSDLTKKHLASAQRTVANLEKNIALSFDVRQRQRAQIGKDAPPLKVETWLNGSELTPDDLKGKVLLLDFFYAATNNDEEWVANLRQLIEWQKKYAERGLVVIGLASYRNHRWDDAAQKPVRVDRNKEKVPPVEERALLTLLAQQYGLNYRLAIQEWEEHVKTMQQFPAMSAPHLVVIDRLGKILLIRGGASEEFTRDVSQTLGTLLGGNVER